MPTIRMMSIVTGIASALLLWMHTRTPASAVGHSRLAVFGMNPNLIGATAAAFILLTTYLGLYDPNRRLRLCGWLATAALLSIILGTGSRGALLAAAIGLMIIAYPMMRRPGVLVTLLVLGGALGYWLIEVTGFAGSQRLVDEAMKDTRETIWRAGWRVFMEQPIIGIGWTHSGRSAGSFQNMYIQTLAETGVIGGLLLSYAIGAIVRRVGETRRIIREFNLDGSAAYLGIGFAFTMLIHGIFESVALFGSTVNAFLLGCGVALVDRCHDVAAGTKRRAQMGWGNVPTYDPRTSSSRSNVSSSDAHLTRHP